MIKEFKFAAIHYVNDYATCNVKGMETYRFYCDDIMKYKIMDETLSFWLGLINNEKLTENEKIYSLLIIYVLKSKKIKTSEFGFKHLNKLYNIILENDTNGQLKKFSDDVESFYNDPFSISLVQLYDMMGDGSFELA